MENQIFAHLKKLECPDHMLIMVKYFMTSVELSKVKDKNNPVELMLKDVKLKTISADSLKQAVTVLKSKGEFYNFFSNIFHINDFPIFKTAILAQGAMNSQAVILKSPNDDKIPFYIFRGFIALFVILEKTIQNIIKNESVPQLMPQKMAIMVYLFKYFLESPLPDPNILSDFLLVLTPFLNIFEHNIRSILNIFPDINISSENVQNKSVNNLLYFYDFFEDILENIINDLNVFVRFKSWNNYIFPVNIFLSYFTKQRVIKKNNRTCQIYLNFIQIIKQITTDDESCPEFVQSKILFLVSSILTLTENPHNALERDETMKICFESLPLFPLLPKLRNDFQSNLVFSTSFVSFINSISKNFEIKKDYIQKIKEKLSNSRKGSFNDANNGNADTNVRELKYMTSQEYFNCNKLMEFSSIFDFADTFHINVIKSLKHFFDNTKFVSKTLYNVLTVIIDTIMENSLVILLASLSGKSIKRCSTNPASDFILKLLQKEVFYKNTSTLEDIDFLTIDSILIFVFNTLSQCKDMLPIFNIISKSNFLILKVLMPVFRSLLMINDEIKFSKSFCESNVIDMIQMNLGKMNDHQDLLDDIVSFLQVIAATDPRLSFTSFSFASLLKELMIKDRYMKTLLPCYRIGILTSDETCVTNILGQIAAIIFQAIEDPTYTNLATEIIFILSQTTSSFTMKEMTTYEERGVFDAIFKLPTVTKKRKILENSLNFALKLCLKYNKYMNIFKDRLIYQQIKTAFDYIEMDFQLLNLLISMVMNKDVNLEEIENYSIQNRSALRLLLNVMKDSKEELNILKLFEKICRSNNSNIFECYQSGFLNFLLERLEVSELQQEVFVLFKLICAMFCSPMTLNKMHECVISSDYNVRVEFLKCILTMIENDGNKDNIIVSSFFSFNGNRTGIFGPSIDISYLKNQWSFLSIVSMYKPGLNLLNLADGNFILSFYFNNNYNLEMKRVEEKLTFVAKFEKYTFEPHKWTYLIICVTQKAINLYINFQLIESINLYPDHTFTFSGNAMIKVGEGFIGEIGTTYFFDTVEINDIHQFIITKGEIAINTNTICSYDPRGAYMGEIIDAASDNLCHLMGTAVPFCTTFKDVVQLDGIYQLFFGCFTIVDSVEYFIVILKILGNIINLSESNAIRFESIGGFRLLIGIFSLIKKEYFTPSVSDQMLSLFKSLCFTPLQKSMINIYWLNFSFISTLPLDFQFHFYKKAFFDAFKIYHGTLSLDSLESMIYETVGNNEIPSNMDESVFFKIKNLQFFILSRLISTKPVELLHKLFLTLMSTNDVYIKTKILTLMTQNSSKENNFPFTVYHLLPLFETNNKEIITLLIDLICKMIDLLTQPIDSLFKANLYIKEEDSNQIYLFILGKMLNSNSSKNNDEIIAVNYIELTPLLFTYAFYSTDDKDIIYQNIFKVLPHLGRFYKENFCIVCLLTFSLKFTNDSEKFVEPFVIAYFSNNELCFPIIDTLNSLSLCFKMKVYEMKLILYKKIMKRMIECKKFIKEFSNNATHFMCYRFSFNNQSQDEVAAENGDNNKIEENSKAPESIIKEIEFKTNFNIEDLLYFFDYLKKSEAASSVEQSFTYEPALIEDLEYLILLFNLISLRNESDEDIFLSTQLKISLKEIKKIILINIKKIDPENELINNPQFKNSHQNLIEEINNEENNASSLNELLDILTKESWQFLIDQKPRFINYRSGFLARLLQPMDSNKHIFKDFKKFAKIVKQKQFMLDKYNLKMAQTYVRELNEKMSESTKKHWKASSKIDMFGRRMFFNVNRNFDDHKKASTLRDSGSFDDQETEQIVPFKKILAINKSIMKMQIPQNKTFEVLMETIIGQFSGTLGVSNTLFFEGVLKYDTFSVKSTNDKELNNRDERQKFLKIPLSRVLFIFNRWTMHIDNSCEIFLSNRKSYKFIFPNRDLRNNFYNSISNLVGSSFKKVKVPYFFNNCRFVCNGICQNNVSNADLVQKTKLCQDWQNRMISNYQYLYFLNIVSGRSFNDLSQYPIFPWVLKDYTSSFIDINDESIYRDFSLPIAAMNQERLNDCYHAYNEVTEFFEKCLYRSHYSSAAFVIGYMIRLEPFTSLHIDLQSGKFDHPERLFYSFEKTWKNITSPSNDFKELIPEFFSFPQILINENKFDLGTLQNSGDKISDVELPNWAKTPYEFIEIHKRCLESDYVRMHINEWIDITFGCYQRSAEKNTLFHIFSYHECINMPELANDTVMKQMAQHHAANFGCCPDKLFNSPSTKSSPLSMTPVSSILSSPSSPTSNSSNVSCASSLLNEKSRIPEESENDDSRNNRKSIIRKEFPHSSSINSMSNKTNSNSCSNAFSFGSNFSQVIYFSPKNFLVIYKNGTVFNILKNTQMCTLPMKIQNDYREIICLPDRHCFIFVQRNGGFATCINLKQSSKSSANNNENQRLLHMSQQIQQQQLQQFQQQLQQQLQQQQENQQLTLKEENIPLSNQSGSFSSSSLLTSNPTIDPPNSNSNSILNSNTNSNSSSNLNSNSNSLLSPQSHASVRLPINSSSLLNALISSAENKNKNINLKNNKIKTIAHNSSTIECIYYVGQGNLVTGGSDCCINLWKVPQFDLKGTVPIQSGAIVALAGDVTIDSVVAIDDQNMVYLATLIPLKHILTFSLKNADIFYQEENLNKHKVLVLRNGMIAIATDSIERKCARISFFDLRGVLIKGIDFDGKITKILPMYPSFGEIFVVVLISPTKQLRVIDIASFDVISTFNDLICNDSVCLFEDRRSILYVRNGQLKETAIYDF